ncbi:MAG: hypothetical protein WCV93_04875 [Candidatus Shapirobacteria bacterium]|jgi:glutaredoxin
MSKIFPLIIAVIVAFIGYRLVVAQISPPVVDNRPSDLVLYWGEGCPHCENVKKYVQDNQIDKRLKIDQKEVYYNKSNQNELTEIVKKCPEIDQTNGVGVPLAWVISESRCLVGDEPIISWIDQKLLK